MTVSFGLMSLTAKDDMMLGCLQTAVEQPQHLPKHKGGCLMSITLDITLLWITSTDAILLTCARTRPVPYVYIDRIAHIKWQDKKFNR